MTFTTKNPRIDYSIFQNDATAASGYSAGLANEGIESCTARKGTKAYTKWLKFYVEGITFVTNRIATGELPNGHNGIWL